MPVELPAEPETVGPFTASDDDITISQNTGTDLVLVISGSPLPLTCDAYPNNSVATGIARSKPRSNRLSPVIAAIDHPLVVTTTSLSDGHVGSSYAAALGASGGNPPYAWRIVLGSGRLPEGLTLNSSTGNISGIPKRRETSTFTVKVLDKKVKEGHRFSRNTATKVLSITIS